MQLIKRPRFKKKGQVRLTLATLAAGLLAGVGARAQDPSSRPAPTSDLFYESRPDTGPETGSRVETGFLYYQESGRRVRALEPSVSASLNLGADRILSLGFTSDTLTGASPNGAVPSDHAQNFLTPIRATGSTVTSTTASGGSSIVKLPPTPGQVAAATLGRQYTIAPNSLPADPGFHDQRFAGNIGWSQPIAAMTKVSFGAGYSAETDFRAITANGSISQDFNSRNTTVSLATGLELDKSDPYGGTPTGLTSMSGQWKGPSENRTVVDGVIGLTQVVTRTWLTQLNYSYGVSRGYNTDPYRIVSIVDSTTGEPLDNLYENRPNKRTRQSIYLDNKVHIYGSVLDVSARYFWDSWGVTSETIQAAERLDVGNAVYIEPQVRWYRQTAASFYHPYLVSGAPLSAFASSDTRLGNFTGMTYGLKLGLALAENSEVNILGQYYKQSGNGLPANAPGQLARQNLFPAVSALSVFVGYSLGF